MQIPVMPHRFFSCSRIILVFATDTLAELCKSAITPQFYATFLDYILYLPIYKQRHLRKKHFKFEALTLIDGYDY
jgi:hypothetical protein